MGFKSNLGLGSNGAHSGAGQGGFGVPFTGAFPIGVPMGPVCPSGYLPAPSAIIPGGVTCVRAPGSYVVPTYMSGRR